MGSASGWSRTAPRESLSRLWITDYITHSVDHGTVYFTVWFKDKTAFSLRYGCDLFIAGADLSDWKTGDDHILRQYMKPIPR